MAAPTDFDHGLTVRLSAAGQPPVRDGSSAERVISVLFETGIEEWRRGWRDSPRLDPTREAIVSASDTTRGATATTQVVPGRRLAYTMVDESADLDRVVDAVSTHVTEAEWKGPSVVVDDIARLLADRGVPDTRSFVAALSGLTGITDVVVGCSHRPEVAAAVRSLFDPSDVAGHVDHPVTGALDRLRRDDPTTFGYVRRHWAEARDGIERCTRNYPQSRQIHASLSEPETTPRTLGATLSGLVRLDVLDTWGETVGSTRYDLTAYDPDLMWVVGAALATSSGGPGADEGSATAGDD
ncbi:hypothetical protein [Halorubrum yunnanense]|uniref:Halobacterial output domain-containing protein n=1 Tax=Halorubrum yunnanense TaxID=1526162 RepID=A0ABD5YAX3_9EURY|nr:hypothetical protein [Halorubrum yunnanense]